ncbi:transmembrane protein 209 [Dorcoceras hygrometricum]|uniref:Transmembrane protein 209 n=1 Tax=Dorcoceras hygrometricum TaxID=472368 RepID=A0A2Z7CLM2_9LAMI|nr:transmembrane protein 209 [Dorcoceras hygrometricum]
MVQKKSSRLQGTPSWSTSLMQEQFKSSSKFKHREMKCRKAQEQIKCSVQARCSKFRAEYKCTDQVQDMGYIHWFNIAAQPVKERCACRWFEIGKRKPDQGSQQLDAYDGEEEGCCKERSNQLGRKPAEKPSQKSDLLSMMNKLARSSSRAGKNRTEQLKSR